MSQCRKRERLVTRWVGRIASDFAMNPKQLFRSIVIRRKIAIPDRPGRRGTLLMFKRFKILFAETRKRRAVDFSVAPNEVVHAGAKWLASAIIPELSCFVSLAVEYRFRTPVLRFFREKIAALEKKNFSTGFVQSIGQRTSTHPGSDNDQVESVHFAKEVTGYRLQLAGCGLRVAGGAGSYLFSICYLLFAIGLSVLGPAPSKLDTSDP